MSKSKIKYGQFKTLYKGKIFNIKQRDVIYPDGRKDIHEYCERFNSVTILAFDDENRLLLTRELRSNINQYVWFLPTGKIDKGETPIKAAQRELREETGLRAKKLKQIFKRSATSEYFLWDIFVFMARDLVTDPLEAEEYFPIKVVPTPIKKATEMAMDGTITNQFLAYYIIRIGYMIRKGLLKW